MIGLAMAAKSGLIPKLLLLFGLHDETICCGKIFMTLCGNVLLGLLIVGFTTFNAYGSFVIHNAERSGLQHEVRWPEAEAKTYYFGSYVVVSLVFVLLMFRCYRKMVITRKGTGTRSKKSEEKNKEQQISYKTRPRNHQI